MWRSHRGSRPERRALCHAPCCLLLTRTPGCRRQAVLGIEATFWALFRHRCLASQRSALQAMRQLTDLDVGLCFRLWYGLQWTGPQLQCVQGPAFLAIRLLQAQPLRRCISPLAATSPCTRCGRAHAGSAGLRSPVCRDERSSVRRRRGAARPLPAGHPPPSVPVSALVVSRLVRPRARVGLARGKGPVSSPSVRAGERTLTSQDFRFRWDHSSSAIPSEERCVGVVFEQLPGFGWSPPAYECMV